MKFNAYGRDSKIENGILHKGRIINKNFKKESPVKNLPYVVLQHLILFLHGYDALSFGEVTSNLVMSSERLFWSNVEK